MQYQLDDPTAYVDEHITVVGSGDAGIENALGLAADAAQGNIVTILNRGADFARAKGPNVALLMEAADTGRIRIYTENQPSESRARLVDAANSRRRGTDRLRSHHC